MNKIITIVLVFHFLFATMPVVSFAQATGTTKSGWFFAFTEEDFNEATSYISQGDKAAFDACMGVSVFPLKANIKVYIMKTKLFSGKMKIRPEGARGGVWVHIEAITVR